jgi:hypothetical protein
MYTGMRALWVPIALYAAFFAQQQVRTCDRRLLIGAFLVGILVATPVCFQRVLMGDPTRLGLWPNLSVVAAAEIIILLDATVRVYSGRTVRAIDAAAAGVASAFGFAVGYTQVLIAPLLGQFAGIVSALTGLAPGILRGWLDATRWNVVPQCDLPIFYLALPASAGAIATLLWNAREHEKRGSALAIAPVIAVATVACAVPQYANIMMRAPFTPASAATLTPAIYYGSIAWLAPLVLACGLYIHAAAWRPEDEKRENRNEK